VQNEHAGQNAQIQNFKWNTPNAKVTSKQYNPLIKIMHKLANWSSSGRSKIKWCKNNQTN
jgi:hypothetical protein